MSSNLAIAITVGATVGGALAGLKNLRAAIGMLKSDAISTGKKLSVLGAGTLVAASSAVSSIKAVSGAVMGLSEEAIKFESAMANVKKVVDFESPEGFKNLKKDILEMTRTIPMSKEELAGIAASGGQLGIAEKDLKSFTTTIAKMGVAFDMSAEQAGDSMAKLANIYKIPISQIDKLGDAVNQLSNSSPAKAADIVNTLGRVGGVAKQFGLTELQTASLSNAFIALGRSPEVAGTSINGMLTKLMTADKQGAKFQKALKNMGLESKSLKKAIAQNGEQALMDFLKQVEKLPKENQMGALVDLFGLEYADDVAALVGGLDTYRKSIEELKKTGKDGKASFIGSMDKEFSARSGTTENGLALLKNSFSELMTVVGERLLPVISKVSSALAGFIQELTDFAAANPALVDSLLILGGILAGVVVGFSGLTALIGVLSISWIVAARAMSPLFTAFKVMRSVGWLFSRVLLQIIRFLPMVGSAFVKLGMMLLTTPIGIALTLLGVAAYMLYRNWDAVVAGAKALWQGLGVFVGGVVNTIVSFFGACWERIKAYFGGGIGNISAQILRWSPLNLFYQVFRGVMSWFGVQLPSSFAQFGANIIQGLWSGLKSKFEAVKAWFAEKAASLKQTFAGVMGIHSPSRVFRRFGGWMMDGLQIGLDRGAASPIASMAGVAGRLKSGFANHMGQMAARVSSGRAAFADARSSQSTGGMTINYNPTINAPGGNPQQIEAALQIGLREFEAMFRRMMDDKARRAY
ncbi:phage tail tape measure protein [Morococcus cerebrosus]|uniref:Phage tail tape measure protein n=2 Tax=Morococcus cerebrosus TaxID=1056807 RepID=A0ABY3YEB9_9NEIS|nr:phage tail tape measure protein [Morococcus cerebrosus]UNV87337.1 phage tail tape measure protein [Morococcus cerebrosus]